MSDRPQTVSLDLLQRLLQTIQTELREMKFAAEIDRKAIDALASTFGSQLGDIEAKLTMRLDSLEALLNDRFEYQDEQMVGLNAKLDLLLMGR